MNEKEKMEILLPIESGDLELKVRGITRRGIVLVPGLIGKWVTVQTTRNETLYAICEGFLPVNRDPDVRDPHLTLSMEDDDGAKIKLRLPKQCIAAIERVDET